MSFVVPRLLNDVSSGHQRTVGGPCWATSGFQISRFGSSACKAGTSAVNLRVAIFSGDAKARARVESRPGLAMLGFN